MLPDGDGKVVPNNSQDLTSSEGVTYTSQCSYFSVFLDTVLVLFYVFPQIFKLCELVLTIPATNVADERSFSALKRLKNYLRNSQSQDKLSSPALINTEKSFLKKLQSKPSILDEVIDLLVMKNRRIDLNYKQ
jgi:hypothetical protein